MTRRPRGTPSHRALSTTLLLLTAACAPLPPGADPIPGSRPGLSDDPVVIERGSLQAEAGIDAGREAGAGFTAGELLVRVGLLTGLEARVALGYGAGGPGPATGAALDDIELSLKVRVAEGGGGWGEPAVAIMPALGLPTGASRLTAGRAEPGALLLFEWEWPDRLGLAANAGGTVAGGEAGRSLESFLGLAAGRELSDRLEAEMEVVRIGDGLLHLAAGFAWLAGPDLQFDGWAGRQWLDDGPAWFVGFGASARLPEQGRR